MRIIGHITASCGVELNVIRLLQDRRRNANLLSYGKSPAGILTVSFSLSTQSNLLFTVFQVPNLRATTLC